jgi:hypothetical protein
MVVKAKKVGLLLKGVKGLTLEQDLILKLLLQVKLNPVVKLLEDVKVFALGLEVGLVNEVRLQGKGGNAK